MKKSKYLYKVLVCPKCKEELRFVKRENKKFLFCEKDKIYYPIERVEYSNDKKKIFVEIPILCEKREIAFHHVKLLKIEKSKLPTSKKMFYNILSKKVSRLPSGSIIIDNGCGTNIFEKFIDRDIISFDLKIQDAYLPIDFIADSMLLPIRNNSVDCYVSNFLMEYMDQPDLYIGEMYRTLKKMGRAYISFFTPYSYFAYFLSIGTYYNYLKKVIKEPISFLSNPIRHLLQRFVRGTNYKTIIEEIKNWKLSFFEDVFRKTGFKVTGKEFIGNIFSLDWIYNPLSSKFSNYGKRGVICLYTLEK